MEDEKGKKLTRAINNLHEKIFEEIRYMPSKMREEVLDFILEIGFGKFSSRVFAVHRLLGKYAKLLNISPTDRREKLGEKLREILTEVKRNEEEEMRG